MQTSSMVHKPHQKAPSPFYTLMEGACIIHVALPEAADSTGESALKWDETGQVTPPTGNDLKDSAVEVEVVRIEPNRFRLAEWGLMSEMAHYFNLHWGDEFCTEDTAEGIHILTKFVMPQPFVHLTAIPRPLKPGVDIDRVVHELGGGWTDELMMKTWSIPRERLEEFYLRISPATDLQQE